MGDAAGKYAQAFMELVAEARLALSKAGPMGALAEAPSAASMQGQGDVNLPRRADPAPASIASADPGNPWDCIEDLSTQAPSWSTSLNNPWQCMMSPTSTSGGTAANSGTVAGGGSMANIKTEAIDSISANDGASLHGVATQPGGTRTAGPWGRPSDEEVFDFIYPFVGMDWETIEGVEPELHEV